MGLCFEVHEQLVYLPRGQLSSLFLVGMGKDIGKTVLIGSNDVEYLGIEGIANTSALVQPRYPAIFMGLLPKNTYVDFVGCR